MSINVTVTGNPVSIKRGKMVTGEEPIHSNKEFQKRRRMRLEQVRQQSKDIAESVRNKVKKEKSKQVSNFEKESASKLKEWQNRKLLELQSEYRECLKDIGLGHTQAKIEEAEESDFIESRDKFYKSRANERGKIAQELQQIDTNEKNLINAIPVQTKKITREVENARAAMVSKMNKSAKKKRKKSLNVSKNISDSETEFHDFINIVGEESASDKSSGYSFKNVSPKRKTPSKRSSHSPSSSGKDEVVESSVRSAKIVGSKGKKLLKFDEISEIGRKRSVSPKGSPKKSSTTLDSFASVRKTIEIPLDTRISDRIKNRQISSHKPQVLTVVPGSEVSSENSQQIYKEEVEKIRAYDGHNKENVLTTRRYVGSSQEPSSAQMISESVSEPEKIFVPCTTCVAKKPKLVSCWSMPQKDSEIYKKSCKCLEEVAKNEESVCSCATLPKACNYRTVEKPCRGLTVNTQKSVEIPPKPTLSVHSSGVHSSDKRDYNKVQYYDHNNRFSTNYIADNSNVQRIPEEDIQVCINSENDDKYQEMINKRQQDANARGKKALEKAKIQKDYEKLMQKLPVLQKQERIASLDPYRDKFHMSDKRLKEYEKNRQQKIESAFEKLVPNKITIPTKKHPQEQAANIPFKVIDLQSPDATKWNDSDYANEHLRQNSFKRNDNLKQDSSKQNDNLKTLLDKLKCQKEMLLRESDNLPDNSNLEKLLIDLVNANNRKAKKDLRAKESSTDSTSSVCDSPKMKRSKSRGKSKKTGKTPIKSSSSLARNKEKHKARRDILILQNMSTQTSPKTIKTAPEAIKAPEKIDKICECKESGDKLCEILIKIQENDKPEILINNQMKSDEVIVSVDDTTERTSNNIQPISSVSQQEPPKQKMGDQKRKRNKKKEVNVQIQKDTKKSSNTSWKEQFSKNDTHITTNSSTSYYSPPDYIRTQSVQNNVSNILHKKPQQSNISQQSQSNKSIDPRLLTYIKKLLVMSKSSLDDLGVSSVSEISTPSSSIIETDSNNPVSKLINVLKFFNISMNDVMQNLNQANATQNSTTTSTLFDSKSSSYDKTKKSAFSSINHGSTLATTVDESVSKIRTQDPREMSLNDYAEVMFPNVIADKYAKLADICQQRISNLSAMIEKVRSEKQQILSPSSSNASDKDNATSYMNLPSNLMHDSLANKAESPEQKELTKRLLQIDVPDRGAAKFVEADKDLIKQLTEAAKNNRDNLDKDIIERYLKLISDNSNKTKNTDFVPVLLDIPKLPKLTVQMSEGYNQTHGKRPPPAKGLNIVRKFNDKIDIIPHELSTIPEADSVRNRSKSPEGFASHASTPIKHKNATIPKSPVKISPQPSTSKQPEACVVNPQPRTEKSSPSPQRINNVHTKTGTDKQSISPKPGTSNQTSEINPKHYPLEVVTIIKKLQEVSTDSSTDKSDLGVETMLRNIGMGWAITTLRKTQETLAQQSSTSSLENTNKSTDTSSDVSLKGFLSKEVLKNISSSTSKSDVSISPFLKEFENISAIQGSNVSVDKQHRTSTPVQTTKSTDKSKNNSSNAQDKIFTAESDISSVKGQSQNNSNLNFISLPDGSQHDDD